MNRMIATLVAASAVCGTAAYAGTLSPAAAASHTWSVQSSAGSGAAAANPNVPGATGRTIVLGDSSTIAGDASATRAQQTGGMTHD
jgi:hypothetical protein